MTREEAIKEYVIPALKHTWNEKINKKVLEALEQKPKMGYWIKGKYKDTCSKCRCTYPKDIGFKNFCPNCGSRNEVEE